MDLQYLFDNGLNLALFWKYLSSRRLGGLFSSLFGEIQKTKIGQELSKYQKSFLRIYHKKDSNLKTVEIWYFSGNFKTILKECFLYLLGLVDSFLGLVGLDRHTEVNHYPPDFYPSSSNNNYNNNYNNQEEEGGLANQILSFIGIKG